MRKMIDEIKEMIACAFAIIALAPNPCTARDKIIIGKLPAKEHNSEPIPNSKKPLKYIFLRLNISDNFPNTGKKHVTASKYTLTTDCMLSIPALN